MGYREDCNLPCAPMFEESAELVRRRKARDYGRSTRHQDGLCGGPAASCADCVGDQVNELMDHVDRYRQAFPRTTGEAAADWYRRLGGRFYDGWPVVAKHLESTPTKETRNG